MQSFPSFASRSITTLQDLPSSAGRGMTEKWAISGPYQAGLIMPLLRSLGSRVSRFYKRGAPSGASLSNCGILQQVRVVFPILPTWLAAD
jgi:hypothetical protein